MDHLPRIVDLATRSDRRRQPTPGEALGSFVRELREARRLSQTRAAELATLSKTTWQQIEGGAGEAARNATLHGVARALDIPAHVLLSLREGSSSIEQARAASRSRAEVIANMGRLFDQVRLSDLRAIEEHLVVLAELRSLQRERSDPGSTG